MNLLRNSDAVPAPRRPTSALAAAEVTVALGGRPVLRRANLELTGGEFVALLGTNGSGKSTLVRACVGLAPLVGGEVRILGTPLQDFRDWRRVGYVPQRPSATSGIPATVREVVAAGRLSLRRPFRPATSTDRLAVEHALDGVGLSGHATDSVAELSGGQQQRVMIARALVGQPELLILDEPTAGVDLETQRVLARLLARLRADGAAILLVAHELGPLERLVDRTVVLRDGRIVYDGPPLAAVAAQSDHSHPHTSQPSRDELLSGEGMWR